VEAIIGLDARQDQHLLGHAPLGRHQRLEVGVESALSPFPYGGEHGLGMPRGEAAAGADDPACTSTGHALWQRGRFSGLATGSARPCG
jgi:hypothetical protein